MKLVGPDPKPVTEQMSQSTFKELQAYCMFVGYGRSGSTLVRSLLDAHPNIIVASEVHALKEINGGIGREELFERLLENSRQCAVPGSWKTRYDYSIPDQWQGRFDRMLVIGDKKAGLSSNQILKDARVLDRLRKLVGLPLRVIFCLRNPFDQITTMCRRAGGDPKSARSLKVAIARFRKRSEGAAKARQRLTPAEWIDVWHEDFVGDPRQGLTQLCGFLEVQCPENWLKPAASMVFDSLHRRRDDGNWTSGLKEQVHDIIRQHEFLSRYNWDN